MKTTKHIHDFWYQAGRFCLCRLTQSLAGADDLAALAAAVNGSSVSALEEACREILTDPAVWWLGSRMRRDALIEAWSAARGWSFLGLAGDLEDEARERMDRRLSLGIDEPHGYGG